MRKFFVCIVLLLTGQMLAVDSANAGAWTQKRGRGYYELKFHFIRANRFYEPEGRIITIPTLAEYTTGFYGEYGLNDWLTIIGDFLAYKRITLNRQIRRETRTVAFPGDSVSGIADIDVGVRIGLLRNGPTVISAGLKLGLPIGDDDQKNGLFTGDGEFNQFLSLQLGHSFSPAPLYFTVKWVSIIAREDFPASFATRPRSAIYSLAA